MNVTILGAGNIGLGFVQRLYYEDSIAITVFSSKNIFENGNLIIKDIENDRVAEINNITVTNDARKSLEDADLILCTYPADQNQSLCLHAFVLPEYFHKS